MIGKHYRDRMVLRGRLHGGSSFGIVRVELGLSISRRRDGSFSTAEERGPIVPMYLFLTVSSYF